MVHTSPSEPDPVLVLGTHRSGTSAVMGMLVEAGGLVVGDVLPPSEANPKGYFESTAVVKSHNAILAARDRDWTCPPSWLEPEDAELVGLTEELEHLQSLGQPWGVKDPRLLFLLPVWARLLPRVRLVGVVRDHQAVVRSLVDRDGLDPLVADVITRAHVRRLRLLCDRLSFPIIDFSSGDVVGRTREVACAHGLSWDDGAARSFFDPGLASQRADAATPDEDIDHLRASGATSAVASSSIDAETLLDALREAAREPDEFDRYAGPRARTRRRAAWAAVPRDMPDAVEYVRWPVVASASDPVPAGREAHQCRDVGQLVDELRRLEGPLDAIVLPDVLSWVHPDDLAPTLALVREHVASRGVVVIGLSRADHEMHELMGWPPPTVGDVRTAARSSGFLLASVKGDDRNRVMTLVATDSLRSLLRDLVDERRPAEAADHLAGSSTPAPAGTDTRDAEAWRRRYLRLRNRRSVRIALRASEAVRPLFRAVRRARAGRSHD